MKVLIPGGAGFIGAELTKFLTRKFGFEVSVIDVNTDYINKNLSDPTFIQHADAFINDQQKMKELKDINRLFFGKTKIE